MTRAGVLSQRAPGFTLVELAVALLIVTLLLGSVMVPLHTQLENRKIEDTQRVLEQAREALLGYVAAFGYFPCPASNLSSGQEPPPPAIVDHVTGACPSYHGFLPAALLGITPVDAEGFALDAWGGATAHRIRYAVSPYAINGVTNRFTQSGGMLAAGIANVAVANAFHICGNGFDVTPGTDCGPPQNTLATNAVVVIWSVGQNAVSGGTNVHEAENPNPSSGGGSLDRLFVSRVRATSGAAEFDDQLHWISTFAVVSRLVASGQLP